MYIEPNSTIKLLKNVPLDNTYEHTINFSNKTQQASWFSVYVKAGMVFERQYYQRHERGYIKLEVLADNVYDCNYLMFQNTAYGNKWFYAFILSANYLNDSVTIIEYEIDDIQTWMFDFELLPCFVEREHSKTDVPGDNLLPENIEIGDAFVVGTETFISNNDSTIGALCTVVAAPFNETYGDYYGGKITNGYSGLYYNIFTGNNQEANAATFISGAGLKKDEIVNVFIAYSYFIRELVGGDYRPAQSNKVALRTPPKNFGVFGNYTPHNKKLYTYPYCYLRLRDGLGNFCEYKYEYFTDPNNIVFELTGDLSPSPSIVCTPKDYMGEHYNYSDAMILTGFPQCAWNSDAYVAWLAQTGIRVVSNAVGAVGEGVITGAITGSVSAGIDAATSGGRQNEIARILSEYQTVKANRRQISGTQGSMLNVAADLLFIEAEQMQIRGEYARIVDSYFTKFGYPVRRVKTPEYNNRPYWNYVKTKGCMAKGNMPNDALRHICSIFDSGITWWSTYATVGNYDYTYQDNSPVSV